MWSRKSEAEAVTEEEEAGVDRTFMLAGKCSIKTATSMMRYQDSFVKMSAHSCSHTSKNICKLAYSSLTLTLTQMMAEQWQLVKQSFDRGSSSVPSRNSRSH